MRSYVFVFVPDSEVGRESEVARKERVDPERQSPNETAATKHEVVDDAEQLPLWRWFTF